MDDSSEQLGESALESGQPIEFTIEPPSESYDAGSDILGFLTSRDSSERASGSTGGSGNSNSQGTKRRGRPKGSKNSGTRSFTSKASTLSENLGDKVAEVFKLIGNQGHKMYGPYGEFWEFSELETGFVSGIADNIGKETIGELDNLSLKSTLVIGGVGVAIMFGFRAWQSYNLTKALKAAVARQQVGYQGAQNPRVNQQQAAPVPQQRDDMQPGYLSMEDMVDLVNNEPQYDLRGIAND